MIISRGRSYIFVHIPKTGGTSLSLALEQRAMKDDILLGDTPKAKKRNRRIKQLSARGRLWKHSTLADIEGVLSPDELSGMTVFTLVRNPWDRLVSYYHWLKVQGFDHPAIALARAHSFEGFVCHPATQQSLRQHPARHYVTRADGIEQCQYFIRLEAFDQDAEPLFDHLGFRITLPHLNRSERAKDYRSYYSAASQEAVAEACAEDIDRFGYSFD
ncbi:sulfotransferase family 2 domain-containing protein [Ruegeria faecimaris]|uniref:Sulfotransferase family protein n=1 Tax=Ruegeria faecimaris TaxID=686389 RepID=A0A521AB54_9RHOB|nr:sulfotransferase family 2 domain-containing protein [Ruegeria faecimaris]SMO32044.1 Sulfotransferase family protein [Ruegeria faecimaris]